MTESGDDLIVVCVATKQAAILLAQGFGDVNAAKWDKPLVLGIKLRVVLYTSSTSPSPSMSFRLRFEKAKSRARLLKPPAETKRPKSLSETLPESSDTLPHSRPPRHSLLAR